MASRARIVVTTTALLAVGAACGISAVGQNADGSPDPDGGASASSSGAGSSSGTSGASSGTTSSGGSSGGSSGTSSDGGADAAVDSAVDAPNDGNVLCPAACSGGCDGGCIINGGQDPKCPPGVARCEVACTQQNDCDTVTCGDAGICRVTCSGSSVCNSDTIHCGTSACQIRCIGKDACNSTTFEGANAQSLCILCDGDPGCNGVTCSAPALCVRQFTGGGSNTVGDCNSSCTPGACL